MTAYPEGPWGDEEEEAPQRHHVEDEISRLREQLRWRGIEISVGIPGGTQPTRVYVRMYGSATWDDARKIVEEAADECLMGDPALRTIHPSFVVIDRTGLGQEDEGKERPDEGDEER